MLLQNDIDELIDCLECEPKQSFADSSKQVFIPQSQTFYSLRRTPYFQFVLDMMEDQNIEVIGLMIPSQIGKSQLLTTIALEYAKRYAGELVLYYCPDADSATNYSAEKLLPSVEESPVYSALIAKNDNGTINRSSLTKNSVKFYNGSEIRALGAGGKTSLVSKTSPLVILDEYARMKSLSKNAGDVLSMAITRTTAKSYGNRKVIAASTPLDSDETIDKLHKESRQYTWEVPCPNCGTYQFLEFANLKWDKPAAAQEVSDIILADMLKSNSLETYYECPHCQCKVKEAEKGKLLNNGRMVCNGNEHLSTKQISIHLNGLYSLEKWPNLAARFIGALNDLTKMREFKNQVLASPWEESLKTKNIKIASIKRSQYPRKVVPHDTFKLVSGIDVQHNRFYHTLLAYTKSKEIHLIDWSEERFDPEDPYNPESFPFKLLEKDYGDGLSIDMIMLDTGDQTLITTELAKRLDRCSPIKGYAKSRYANQYHFISKTTPDLILVPQYDTNELLETLITSKVFCVPDGLEDNEELFSHLTNVIRKGDKYVDRTNGARTDYRDSVRYALSYIMMCDFGGEIDQIKYQEDNQKEIDRRREANMQALRNLF